MLYWVWPWPRVAVENDVPTDVGLLRISKPLLDGGKLGAIRRASGCGRRRCSARHRQGARGCSAGCRSRRRRADVVNRCTRERLRRGPKLRWILVVWINASRLQNRVEAVIQLFAYMYFQCFWAVTGAVSQFGCALIVRISCDVADQVPPMAIRPRLRTRRRSFGGRSVRLQDCRFVWPRKLHCVSRSSDRSRYSGVPAWGNAA